MLLVNKTDATGSLTVARPRTSRIRQLAFVPRRTSPLHLDDGSALALGELRCYVQRCGATVEQHDNVIVRMHTHLVREQTAVLGGGRRVPAAALAMLLAAAHLEELAVVHTVRLLAVVVHLDAKLARRRVLGVAALEEVALVGLRACVHVARARLRGRALRLAVLLIAVGRARQRTSARLRATAARGGAGAELAPDADGGAARAARAALHRAERALGAGGARAGAAGCRGVRAGRAVLARLRAGLRDLGAELARRAVLAAERRPVMLVRLHRLELARRTARAHAAALLRRAREVLARVALAVHLGDVLAHLVGRADLGLVLEFARRAARARARLRVDVGRHIELEELA